MEHDRTEQPAPGLRSGDHPSGIARKLAQPSFVLPSTPSCLERIRQATRFAHLAVSFEMEMCVAMTRAHPTCFCTGGFDPLAVRVVRCQLAVHLVEQGDPDLPQETGRDVLAVEGERHLLPDVV